MNAITVLAGLWSAAFFGATKKEPASTLVVSYGAVGCTCTQWVINTKSFVKYPEYIYLERNKATLAEADDLWDGNNIPLQLRVKGYFKLGKGVPARFMTARYLTRGRPDPARIFCYTSFTVLKNGHRTR
ncbi:hypothetical protein [Hymenobacter convexus]|uniref:hypothetical protein n=1 Tax=Hymenobacter sp. CA1UV-4 TaxID=3063782 RepID=UPI00272AEE05|nr:hypothetical protein [Hymenobacter sp. CA1UV-4]